MNVAFYKLVRLAGRAVFRVASTPCILHAERARRPGAYILAANHRSPYDAALLIASVPRVIHWISIVEVFRNPLARRFLEGIGALPLDRSRVDSRTVRAVLRNLHAGRVVGIFPEGRMRAGSDSVLSGGGIDNGVCRLSQLAGAPVLPCVVLGGEKFALRRSWRPFARTRWAVAFGEPIFPRKPTGAGAAQIPMADEIALALRMLHAEVSGHV